MLDIAIDLKRIKLQGGLHFFLQNFMLKEMNLHSLQQINALAQLKKLHSLSIDCGAGNPVTQFALWKPYTLFRLSHLSLKKLNGDEVKEESAI